MNRHLAALAAEAWAIQPAALDSIVARMDDHHDEYHVAGVFGSLNESQQAALDARNAITYADPAAFDPELLAAIGSGRAASVGVIAIQGPITKRDSLFTMIFGGTSTVRISQQLRQLAADDSVGTILLNVDSPGGTVSGLPEVAADIRRARESKRVVALANDLSASAAYWMTAQADEIVATPEALVGSVGVFAMHTDLSGALEQEGVKVTYISAGRYKVEGNPFEPLSDEAAQHMQSIVDESYGLFVKDVAKGRNVTAAQVRADYGEGRVLTASKAKAAGMVDRIATFSDALGRLSGARKADAEMPELVADSDLELRLRRWRVAS